MSYYVYHIKRPGMGLDEGYIGVTLKLNKRWKAHCQSDYHVGRAIRKYNLTRDDMVVLVECSGGYALELEEKLRPSKSIGWNLVKGGGKPPLNFMFGDDNPQRRPEQRARAAAVGRTKVGSKNSFYGRKHSINTKMRIKLTKSRTVREVLYEHKYNRHK